MRAVLFGANRTDSSNKSARLQFLFDFLIIFEYQIDKRYNSIISVLKLYDFVLKYNKTNKEVMIIESNE